MYEYLYWIVRDDRLIAVRLSSDSEKNIEVIISSSPMNNLSWVYTVRYSAEFAGSPENLPV